MPTEPYIIFGFDVDPGDPNAAQIMADLEATFPPLPGMASLGVANTYLVEVGQGEEDQRLRALIKYFRGKDTEHGGALRWAAQLCRSAEFGNG